MFRVHNNKNVFAKILIKSAKLWDYKKIHSTNSFEIKLVFRTK